MDLSEIKAAAFEIITENDPYKASKQLQVKNWCYAFIDIFNKYGRSREFNLEILEFFLHAFSDNECWEKVDTIHRIMLNRRVMARKMVQERNSRGKRNRLEEFFRYILACWCCLEEEIYAIFNEMKPKVEIGTDDRAVVKKYAKWLFKDQWHDSILMYWLHLVAGCETEFQSSSKHLYEYGLELVLEKYTCYVEAVEYFWNKIKSLPDEELNERHKNEIFMKTLVRAAGTHCGRYPEVFEFCISQVNPDIYPEILKRDLEENQDYGSLKVLQDNLRFDLFKKLFDCLQPGNVSEKLYHNWLIHLEIEEYDEYYANEAVKLFKHMWMKKGYERHRNRVVRKEFTDVHNRGTLLVPLVKKNHMDLVWKILEKAHPDQFKSFINSTKGFYICFVLDQRGDHDSLNLIDSYKSIACRFSINDDDLNEATEPSAKRSRIE